jgi:hypothetical protein
MMTFEWQRVACNMLCRWHSWFVAACIVTDASAVVLVYAGLCCDRRFCYHWRSAGPSCWHSLCFCWHSYCCQVLNAVDVPGVPAWARVFAIAASYPYCTALDVPSATDVYIVSDAPAVVGVPAGAGIPAMVNILSLIVLPCPVVSCAAVSPSIAVVLSAVNVPGVPAVVFALLLLASVLLIVSLVPTYFMFLLLVVFPLVLASLMLLASCAVTVLCCAAVRPPVLTAVVSSLESLL